MQRQTRRPDLRAPQHRRHRSGSLYEAAALGVALLKCDDWTKKIAPRTPLEVRVRVPGATHWPTFQQLARWLDGDPSDVLRKAKLK